MDVLTAAPQSDINEVVKAILLQGVRDTIMGDREPRTDLPPSAHCMRTLIIPNM